MALFQQNQGSSSSSKNLVEFKCGRMHLNGTTVTADKRKGLLYIYRDECTHLCWKDRSTGKLEDDLMMFPGDAEFVHVPQCKTGRVYLLKFKEGNMKLFFWMQEPDSKKDKDEELMKKVNEALNNPSAANSFHEGRSRREANDPEEALMQILQGASGNTQSQIQQLQSLLQQTQRNQARVSRDKKESDKKKSEKKSEAPATEGVANEAAGATAVATPTATPASSAADASTGAGTGAPASGVQLEDLQNILRNMPGVDTDGAPVRTMIDISEAMKPEDIIPLLANETIREKLIAYLPPDSEIPKTEAELKETLRSPQFKHACFAFSNALSTGQLGPALQQFGVSPAAVAAANSGDVKGFAEAMEKDAAEKAKSTEEDMQTE